MTSSPACDAPEEVARLRALIDASPLGLGRIEGRRITFASAAIAEVTGYDAETLTGHDTRLLYFSDTEHEAAGREIGEQIARSGKFRLEARLRNRRGEEIWARLSGKPLDPGRPGEGFCFIAEDITAQRRNAVELGAILDAAPIAIACVAERRYVWVNPAFETLMGYGSTELKGQSTRTFYENDEAFEAFGRRHYPAIAAGCIIEDEVTMVARDGRRLQCEIVGRALEAGHPERGAIFMYRDIGARKAAEAALRAGEQRLRALLDSLPDMVWLKDAEGRHLAVNKPLAAYCGRTPQDIVGRTDAELFPAETARRYRNEDLAVMQSRQTSRKEERITDREGRVRWLDVIKAPIFGEDGEVSGTAGIARDITDSHDMATRIESYAETLAERNSTLVVANRAKTDFLNTMQHELKTPLNAIIGFSELLAQGVPQPLPPEQQAFAQDIHDAGRHLLDLINDILTYSRGESGELELQAESLEVGPFLNGSLQAFRKEAEEKNIGLALSVAADCGTIAADRQYLRKILDNLLSNALKFTPGGGKITIQAETGARHRCGRHQTCARGGTPSCGSCLLISVRDTGIGIAEKDAHRLFQPFMQLSSGLARPAAGTGLGLLIARRLAELHGGSLDYQKNPGKGSTFILALPLQDGAHAAQKEKTP